jgi:hypothetical protein
MNRRSITATIGALAAATTMTLYAQEPRTPQTPQAPQAAQPAQTPAPAAAPEQTPARPAPTITQPPERAMPANPSITITGCLKEEKDVPALKPNAVERAGVTNDYVLTEVKISPGSAVSGIGVSSKYEVEGIAEADLKKHLNQQVELVGQIVQAAAGAAATDAPDFRATSIKMLSATCNAAQ